MNLRIAGIIGTLIGIAIVTTMNFSNNDNKKIEKCRATMTEQLQKSPTIMNRAIDVEGTCKCMIEDMKGGKTITVANSTDCTIKNSREGFLRLCQQELIPILQKENNINFDCACYFDKSTTSAKEFFAKGKTSITPAEQQTMAEKDMMACIR